MYVINGYKMISGIPYSTPNPQTFPCPGTEKYKIVFISKRIVSAKDIINHMLNKRYYRLWILVSNKQ